MQHALFDRVHKWDSCTLSYDKNVTRLGIKNLVSLIFYFFALWIWNISVYLYIKLVADLIRRLCQWVNSNWTSTYFRMEK